MNNSILIIGGDSEIGAAAAEHLRRLGWNVKATTRRRDRVAADRPFLDLAEPVGDWQPPSEIRAACICAAIARLADCAKDPQYSSLINVTRTIELTDRLLTAGLPVLFLSTDKVFDGRRSLVPPDAPPCPISEYGRQKAAGENEFRRRMERGAPLAILRLAKVVSPGMALFRQWIAELEAARPVKAFFDMMMAPTPVALVATAIERLLTTPLAGIFQLTGPHDIAYTDVARHFAHRLSANPELVQRSTAKSAGLPVGSWAPNTTLDSSALRRRFGIVVPGAIEVVDALFDSCR